MKSKNLLMFGELALIANMAFGTAFASGENVLRTENGNPSNPVSGALINFVDKSVLKPIGDFAPMAVSGEGSLTKIIGGTTFTLERSILEIVELDGGSHEHVPYCWTNGTSSNGTLDVIIPDKEGIKNIEKSDPERGFSIGMNPNQVSDNEFYERSKGQTFGLVSTEDACIIVRTNETDINKGQP
jgi:hypothetical protein